MIHLRDVSKSYSRGEQAVLACAVDRLDVEAGEQVGSDADCVAQADFLRDHLQQRRVEIEELFHPSTLEAYSL